jgi:hypothetical protein
MAIGEICVGRKTGRFADRYARETDPTEEVGQ